MEMIRVNIVNPINKDMTEVIIDVVITISDGKIAAVDPYDSHKHSRAIDMLDCVAIPGFIDLHVHLSQYLARGKHEPALLPWLSKHIFPAEARSADPDYARSIAHYFFRALSAYGTTCAVIYTAPYQQTCNTAFEVASEYGSRALIGMTLMDANSPDDLIQTTDYAYSSSVELFHKWNDPAGLLQYIFTPRFAPTCSAALMSKIGSFANENNAWIQSHLSENKDELKWVKELFGEETYTDVYQRYGILGPRTIMAHAIHLTKSEMELLKSTGTKIAHCPDSNFYLKSGEFDYASMSESGLSIGIGSDVGAGTTLNMLYHAKMTSFRQSANPISPERLLWHITLGNAELLGLSDRIGSIECGKDADIVFVRIPDEYPIDESLPSVLCYCGHEFQIAQTMIRGRTVHRI